MKKIIEMYMNSRVFGKTENAGQWSIPLDQQGQLEKISLTNRQARSVSDHLVEIAPTCLPNLDPDHQAEWTKALS